MGRFSNQKQTSLTLCAKWNKRRVASCFIHSSAPSIWSLRIRIRLDRVFTGFLTGFYGIGWWNYRPFHFGHGLAVEAQVETATGRVHAHPQLKSKLIQVDWIIIPLSGFSCVFYCNRNWFHRMFTESLLVLLGFAGPLRVFEGKKMLKMLRFNSKQSTISLLMFFICQLSHFFSHFCITGNTLALCKLSGSSIFFEAALSWTEFARICRFRCDCYGDCFNQSDDRRRWEADSNVATDRLPRRRRFPRAGVDSHRIERTSNWNGVVNEAILFLRKKTTRIGLKKWTLVRRLGNNKIVTIQWSVQGRRRKRFPKRKGKGRRTLPGPLTVVYHS